MKTPEQELELEEHKILFGVSFFHKTENRVMHPNTIRFYKEESGNVLRLAERVQWLDPKTDDKIINHAIGDVEVDKIEGYPN